MNTNRFCRQLLNICMFLMITSPYCYASEAAADNRVNRGPGVSGVSSDPDIQIYPLSLDFVEPDPVQTPAPPGTDPLFSTMQFTQKTISSLSAKLRKRGKVNLIVGFNMTTQLEGKLTAMQAQQQRQGIRARGNQLASELRGLNAQIRHQFESVPFMALTADQATLDFLTRSPMVASINEDTISRPQMASSNPVIGSPLAWAAGYDGNGWAVVVLDTGVDNTHPWFTTPVDKVVEEACYSSNVIDEAASFCPGGVSSSTEKNSAMYCDLAIGGCDHGTHVAGSVAGNDEIGPNFGVARGADIIAMQVFSKFLTETDCGIGQAPCAASFSSDQVAALERVLVLADSLNIAAVNMSLGGDRYFDQASCDADNLAVKAAIDNLRSVGIATVIAAGNNGWTDSILAPGCISTAVSVGATSDSDQIASFSNIYPQIHLLAPGVSIDSSVPDGGIGRKQGTSMSTPHVAGAWAIMKQLNPNASVSEVLATLQNTAIPVSDTRSGGIETDLPRIDLESSINAHDVIFHDGLEGDRVPHPTPDLILINPAVSNSGLSPGQAFTINATVANQGDGDSATTTLRYYLSSDNVIGNSDTALGEDVIQGLAPGANSVKSLAVTAPGINGNYWVGACVDAVADESDTDNQCSVGIEIIVVSFVDSDGDRLPDSAETNTGIYVDTNNTGTDPDNADTDGDGIKDGDEVLGTTGGLDLPAMGTNPLRKDLLLEYDWFDDALDCGSHSHRPNAAVIASASAAFSNSPVTNPGGSNGVNLINDYGQGGVFTGGNLINDANGVIDGGVGDAEFKNLKAGNFAPNRNGYFHYVLLPHRYNTNSDSSGQAEVPGDDLIVSLYCSNTNKNVAHTVLHEVGHNLGLHHGGNERCNFKPNYNSVMNYLYQFPGIDNNCTPPADGVLSYSVGDRIDLDENNLDENNGTCGSGESWDWNKNGTIESSVTANINADDNSEAANCGNTLTTLRDYNDWGNIYLGGQGDATGAMTVQKEIITEQPVPAEFMNGSD